MIYNYWLAMLLLLQSWWLTRNEVSEMGEIVTLITAGVVVAGTVLAQILLYKRDAARFDRIDNALSKNLGDGSKTLRDEHTTLRDEHTTLRDEHTTLREEHKDIEHKVDNTLEAAKEIKHFVINERRNQETAIRNGIDTDSAITAIRAMERLLNDKEEQLRSKDRQLQELNQELAETRNDLSLANQEIDNLSQEVKELKQEKHRDDRNAR